MKKFRDEFDFEFEETDRHDREDRGLVDRDEDRRKNSRRFAIFVVIAMCLVIAVGVTIVIQLRGNHNAGRRDRQNNFMGRDAHDDRNAIRPRNFQPLPGIGNFPNARNQLSKPKRTIVPLDDPVKKELDVFFKKFLNAMKTKNKNSLSQCFDFEEIVAKVNENLMQRNLNSSYLIRDRSELENGFVSGLRMGSNHLQIQKFETSRIFRIGPSDKFLVYIDLYVPNGNGKWKFLVHRKETEFRILDFGNVISGFDTLTILSDLAFLNSRGGRFSNQGQANFNIIQTTLLAFVREKLDDAEKHLNNYNENFSTKNINASYHQIKALLALSREEYENTLSHCERIKELLDETPPFVHFLLSDAHRMLGHYDLALKSAEIYVGEFGEDPIGLTQLALAQFYKGQKEQAAENAIKSLKKDPDTPSLVYVLASSEEETRKSDFLLSLSKMKQSEDNYREIFDLFAEDNNFEMLNIALDEFEKTHTDRSFGTFYRAKVLFGQEKYRKAVELLKPILSDVQKREDAWDIEELYFNSLYILDESKAIDAYSKSTRPKYFFEYICMGLLRDKSFDNLRRLLELHRKKVPDDPTLHRYAGELAFHDRKWEKAFEELFIAYRSEYSEEVREPIRIKIFAAAYRSDKVSELYNKWDNKEQFFRGVAAHFRIHHGPAKLERLVLLHKHRLATRDSFYYDALISVARREFPKAVQVLASRSSVVVGDTEEETKPRELYLRLMLRLGKIEQGYVNSNNFHEAMVYLGNRLIYRKNISGLEQLVSASRQHNASYYWFDYYDGKLAELKGDWDRAADYYRTGYIETKDTKVYLDELANALYKANRPMEAYYLVKEKKEIFAELASKMSQGRNWTALNTLIAAHRRSFPTDLAVAKFEAKYLLAKNRFNEAINLLNPLLERNSRNAEPYGLMAIFAEASVKAGKTVEVYRKRKEKDSIYESLITELLQQKKHDEISELVEEHRKNNPKYPRLEYHLGRAEEENKEWTKAVEHYRKGYKTADAENKKVYRSNLVKAEFYAGNVPKLLDEFPKERSVFEQLAKIASLEEIVTNEETIGFLEILTERWKKDHSENHSFCLFWTARIHLLKSENIEAAKIFQTHYRKLVDDKTNAVATERNLVYALLYEKNFVDAKKYAILGYRRVGDPWLPTLTAIAAEDLDEAIGWTYDLLAWGYSLKHLYDAKIVSDILRSKAFDKFRKKYPPPKRALAIVP